MYVKVGGNLTEARESQLETLVGDSESENEQLMGSKVENIAGFEFREFDPDVVFLIGEGEGLGKLFYK